MVQHDVRRMFVAAAMAALIPGYAHATLTSAQADSLAQTEFNLGHTSHQHIVWRSALTGHGWYVLYLLPTGEPAAGVVPPDLNERDHIEVVVLMPNSATMDPSLKLVSCPKRNLRRVNGPPPKAKGMKALGVHPKISTTIKEIDLGPIQCGAGTVTFTVKTQYNTAGATTSLELQPVYWISPSVQLTFAFGEVGSINVAVNNEADARIVRDENVFGARAVVAFVWHPFGSDQQHPALFSALLNPSLGFDVTQPTSAFYLGDQICISGICLAVGGYVRQIDELKPGSGLNIGSVLPKGTTSVATEPVWTRFHGGSGWYLGVTLDSSVVDTLRKDL